MTMYFFRKKIIMATKHQLLDDLCEKFIDSMSKKYSKKVDYMRITQSKNGRIYLIIRKKRGRLIHQDKKRLFFEAEWIAKSEYCWHSDNSRFTYRNLFENFRLLKETSGYHFHLLLISVDYYCNGSFFSRWV